MSNQGFDSKLAGIRPAVIEPPWRAQTAKMKRFLGQGSLVFLLTTGCASETLFKSNFDVNAIGQPPSHAQEVGTVAVHGLPGSVVVIAPLVTPSERWVQISRSNQNPPSSDVSGLQGRLSQFRGDGTYDFSTALFIPSNSGVATIQFERAGQSIDQFQSFLHIDFMEDNRVQINHDPSTKFGTFPRDQLFLVRVTLNIKPSASAHIVLSGAGASGEADHKLVPDVWARQFGAFRIWMGWPITGSFHATNIVVQRRKE